MALPKLVPPCFLLLVLVSASSGSSESSGSLLKCYQTPPGTNSTALHPLLDALPSAAAPTGFASLRSGGTGRDRAFARALCFGDSTPPADCLRCVSDAARNITAGCGTSRRAGVWTDACFVTYAIDTNASSPSADAFRSRAIISGSESERVGNVSEQSDLRNLAAVARSLAPRAAADRARMLATADATAVASDYASRSTVRVLAQCARDRTPAECQRCLEDSAREVARCCWGLDPWRGGGRGRLQLLPPLRGRHCTGGAARVDLNGRPVAMAVPKQREQIKPDFATDMQDLDQSIRKHRDK
uniref:Uncharacterized protein n=1 Tax=Avena sativa TaxID=4498 RepID=A0ACD5V5R4_AVESA